MISTLKSEQSVEGDNNLQAGRDINQYGISYADAKEINTVIIIGEDEVEKGQLIIKNMKTGEQTKVSRKEWFKREI